MINNVMNYLEHYNRLINRAKDRILDIYTETHHIIPKCINGTDDKNNLVNLTPEEHYVAHQLLIKIYPNNFKLINAAVMMSLNTNGNRPKNKLYGWLRRKLAEVNSIQQSGINNSQFGTCWVYNIEEKISKKVRKQDLEKYINLGWHKGRMYSFNNRIFGCIICGNIFPDRNRNTNHKTCSDICFKTLIGQNGHRAGPMYGREKEFLDLYKRNKNIDKSLKIMGFIGNQAAYGKWARKLIAGIVQ